MKQSESFNATSTWQRYENGIKFKTKIGLYEQVKENYNYYIGEQWGDTQSEGLPTPVFNIIKPVINYKVSQIFDKPAVVVYKSINNRDKEYPLFEEIANKLTDYAEILFELLKVEKKNKQMVIEGGITGNGIQHLYQNLETGEVVSELIDITNLYAGNPYSGDVQSQPYIIIAFRMSTEEVKEEARKYRELECNKLTDSDIEEIADDSENRYEAGDNAEIDMDGLGMTTVLLEYSKRNGRVFMTKATKSCKYIDDYDTGLKLYPIVKFDWEPKKKSFYSKGDVESAIPNQDYINTIAAMYMASQTFTAFPKMVYNEDYVDNPSNQIGVAIGVQGSNVSLKDVIGYITPGNVSGDVFQMFRNTMDITKELMGANDAALGNVDPDKASGRAIVAVMEQTQVPLENVRSRFYDSLEDMAQIIADFWRAYTDEGTSKEFIAKDENGNETTYQLTKEGLDKLLLRVRIDVGTSNRWSQTLVEEALQNLLAGKYISFDMFLDALPDNGIIPKKKLQDLINREKLRQAEENPNGDEAPDDFDPNMIASEMLNQKNIDIDSLIESMPPEQQQMYLENPQLLKEFIMGQLENN